jgi:iron complex transport system substrate-binding protein
MTGHRTPRRPSARPDLPPSKRRQSRSTVLLLLLLLILAAATMVALAGCGSDGNGAGAWATVTDDNGNTVTINAKPERIVSTAPANTETLFALGVGDRVVGVNSLDDYPPEVADIAKIGDYQANTEAIMALSPDLVVGYSGNEEALAPVQAAGAPVLIMNPTTVEGIYANITAIGAATGAIRAAADLVASLKNSIAEIGEAAKAAGDSPKVFYALDNTLWTCGPGSFVDELLTLAQAANVASTTAGGSAAQAYYQFTPEQLVAADPAVILLPGSVYKSADEFTSDARFAGLKAVKEGRVYVIDDVIVTRPGPRIAEGLKILMEAVHPGAL